MGRTNTERQELLGAIELEVPAIKIRNIDAFIENIQTEVIANKVIVQGQVHKQIFYVGEDNRVHHQQEIMPFSTFIEVEGASPGMDAQTSGIIEHIKAELSPDGTLLHQKVILELFIKVLEIQQLNLILDQQGPLLKLDQVIGEGSTQTLLEGAVDLSPTAIKVTDVDVHIQNLTHHVIEDKVIIQGILEKQLYFIGQDDLGYHQQEEIPFSSFVDIPGAQPGMMVQIYPEVEFLGGTLSPDGTSFQQEVVIEFFVKVTEEQQTNVAQGEGPLIKLPRVIGEDSTQHMQTNDFTLPQPAIKIVNVDAHFLDISTRIIENKVIVQGTLEKQIYFIGEDDVEYHQAEQINFSTFLDLPGAQPGMDVQIHPSIEHIHFNLLQPTQLHQKTVLEFFIKVLEWLQFNAPTATAGDLYKVPVVIGENTKQILVDRVAPVPPPIPEVLVAGALIREAVREEVQEQTLVESEIDLPQPAIKIKEISAEIQNVTTEILNGEVLVEGEIVKQIRYVNTQNQVNHFEEIVPFSLTLEIPPLQEGMELDVEVEIEDISFQLVNEGNRITQIVVLEVTVFGEIDRQVEVIENVEGPNIVPTRIQVIADRVIGDDVVETNVVENIDLPEPAAFPVAVEAFLTDIEGTVETDQVTVQGTIVKELTLAREDETEFTVSEEIPFEFTTTITGAQPGDELEISPAIVDILVELINEGTVAQQTVVLETFVKVLRTETMFVVTAVEGPVVVETETLLLDVVDDGIPEPVPVEVVVSVEPE